MKKANKILCILPLLLSNNLMSCGKDANYTHAFKYNFFASYADNGISKETIEASYSKYSASIEFDTIDYYKQLIEDKKDFILFYDNPSCLSCKQFRPIRNEALFKSEILTYSIDRELYDNNASIFKHTVKSSPSILFYNKGKFKTELNYKNSKSAFTSVNGLLKAINKNAKVVDIYYESNYEVKSVNEEHYITFTSNKDGFNFLSDKKYNKSYRKDNKITVLGLYDYDNFRYLINYDMYYLSNQFYDNTFSFRDLNELAYFNPNTNKLQCIFYVDGVKREYPHKVYDDNDMENYKETYAPYVIASRPDGTIIKHQFITSYDELLEFTKKYQKS